MRNKIYKSNIHLIFTLHNNSVNIIHRITQNLGSQADLI